MIGFMGAMISNLAFVFRNIFSKRGMKRKSVGGMNYYACLSMLSLLILTPFAIAVEGPQLWAAGWQTAISEIHMFGYHFKMIGSDCFHRTMVSSSILFFLDVVPKVPLAESEHLLQSHPKIADVALIPYHVEEAWQIPMAFVVRKPGSNLSAAQVLEFVAKQACLLKTKRLILNAYLGFSFISSKPDEGKIVGDPLSNLGKGGGAVLMVCRTCGKRGDRWTAQCPFKDLAQPPESFVDKPPASETTAPSSGTSKGAYVPPSQRAGADRSGHDMRIRNDENSVRVTNLSDDTRELDLQDLFSTFGPVSRVYIAYD
ncbi:hypothetical protein IFM89_014453 [Coptis chinensis]|uniref:RRM domain-containing protein n=1 Tax=Coptis chinensis TaxID=261450 RepID=A0A835I2C6_9MAGN|nr:hypothetical protein IFM89_014453 [Coptis chinensis]